MCRLVKLFSWPQKCGGQVTHGKKSWVCQAVWSQKSSSWLWCVNIWQTWRNNSWFERNSGSAGGWEKVLVGAKYLSTVGSLLCLQDPLLCGCGTASCGREDLCLICTLSPHKEGGFFWGIWMKVIPDALITLLKTLNWEEGAVTKHSFIFCCLLPPWYRKNKPYRLIQRLQYCSIFFFLFYQFVLW